MIQRLNSNVSFQGVTPTTPREGYDFLINNNSQTAQKQNNAVINMASAQKLSPVPMQGTGQKLDVIA